MRRTWIGLALLLASGRVLAQTPINPPPSLINFQGRLAKPDGTPVADGNAYSLTLSLWDAQSGGAMRWSQTFTGVTVHNGVFAIALNLGSGFTNGNTLDSALNNATYLQVQVGTDPPLTPRQQLVSTAYALKAATVPDGAITQSKLSTDVINSLRNGAAGGDLIGAYPSPQIRTDSSLLNKVSGTLLSVNAPTTVIDQSQTSQSALSIESAWQSFKPSLSGTLVEIDIFCGTSGVATSATLTLYSGQGTAGVALQTIPVTINPALGLQSFPITANVTAGQTYTWAVGSNDNLLFGYTGGELYPDGQSDLGATFDYDFQTRMRVTQGSATLINTAATLFQTSGYYLSQNALVGPMLVKQYDPFTSGTYTGSGRSGLFQAAPDTLFGGMADTAAGTRSIRFGTWSADSATRTDLLTLLNNGNLGIGTTAPAQKLSVAGTIQATSGGFMFPDGTMQTKAALGGNIWATTNGTDIFNTNTGKVGIGTNVPQQALSVFGGIVLDQGSANTGSLINGLTFGGSSGEGIASKRSAGGNQNGLDFYTGSAKRLSVTNVGKVGIGTSAPTNALSVAGNADFSGSLSAASATLPILNGNVSIIGNSAISGTATIAGAATLNSNAIIAGSVGIGAASPAAKLDVEGAVVHGNVVSLGNFGADGAIGAAGATVDVTSTILINQNAAFRSLTLPNPSNTTAGRMARIVNTGTQKFQVQSAALIPPGRAMSFLWTGGAWLPDTSLKRVLTGTVNVGDIGGGVSPRNLSVTGDFTSATLTTLDSSSSQTTVNLAWSLSSYIVIITIGTTDGSASGFQNTNDAKPPVTGLLNPTSFQIRWEETSSNPQTTLAQIMVIEQ